MNLPNRRQPFEARDYIKAREYLNERVEAGDFNPRPFPAASVAWGDLGQASPSADMRRQHECLTNEADLGVFG
jgi:hypothetical protein